jgi:hypothetical protein
MTNKALPASGGNWGEGNRREIELPSSACISPRRGHRLRRALPTLTTTSPPQDLSLPSLPHPPPPPGLRALVWRSAGGASGAPGLVVEFSALASQIYADARRSKAREGCAKFPKCHFARSTAAASPRRRSSPPSPLPSPLRMKPSSLAGQPLLRGPIEE